METRVKARALFDPPIVRRAIIDSFLKLDPRHQVKNPVMFVVEVGSVLTTLLFLYGLGGIIVPFIGIKLIDMLRVACGLV